MKKVNQIILCTVLAIITCTGCTSRNDGVVWNFSHELTMAGHKVSLKEFDKDFPTDWSAYNYLVLELTASTSQRVYFGLNTDGGYNELRLSFYAPGGRVRTVIPLTYFRDEPTGSHDLAATYNHKRPFTSINIDHGKRSNLVGVDSLGMRLHLPIHDENITIHKAWLSVEDPGDEYLSDVPALDEFGQWNMKDYEGKVHSEEELRAEWAKEDEAIASYRNTKYSRYGGDLSRKTKATGFFYVKQIDGKWWFVDPEGYLFLSLSSCGITPDSDGELHRHMQELRFGTEDTYRKANELIVGRMSLWGINTIGNWSSKDLIAMDAKPFMTSLHGIGIFEGILGMPDVYAPGFRAMVEEGVRSSVEPFVNDRMLVGYFIGNEPTWSNKEQMLCEHILAADESTPIRKAMLDYLKVHGDTPKTRNDFVYDTYEIFLKTVNRALQKYDPHHLNLGIRYGSGVPAPRVLDLSKKYFDVYSYNNYGLDPNLENMDIIYEATGMPMIIGEYHFGTTDRGLGESLVRVNSQEERAVAFKNYTEKAFSHKALIGAAWFIWYDQPILGRRDGENYNCGLLDITDRPYEPLVGAVREVADNCYDVHDGKKAPFSSRLERVAGICGVPFPDIWEE